VLFMGHDLSREIRKADERYRTFIENSLEGIYRIELSRPFSTNLAVDAQVERFFPNAYVAECNEVWAKIHGFESSVDAVGSGVRHMWGPDEESSENRLRGWIEAGYRYYQVERCERSPDGETRWLLDSNSGVVERGRLVRVWGVQLDVTPRRLAEENLRRSEEHFRSLIENSSDVFTVLAEDGAICYSSPSVERVLGYKPEDNKGASIFSLIHPDDVARIREVFRRAMQQVDEPQHIELRIRHKDGTWHSLEASGKTMTDPSGELRGVINYRDVTNRKRLEEQLRESQKMEAIGHLAGGVAHDFNNLLQAIHGYTTIVLEDLAPGDSHREDLQEVEKAAERAARLTNQLLAFGRRQTIKPTDLDLNEVVANLMKMIQRIIGEHIVLDIIPGHNLGTIHADRGQMEQVLVNLCINARDAMPEGGRITIETENVLFDSEYCRTHEWSKPGWHVLLSATDTGCGMDQKTLDRVFDPFFTTKEVGEGTGLGLSTVYGILRQHDGMVRVYSEPAKGTTFKVYLPCIERPAAVVGNKIESPVKGGNETILLAEDEEVVRELGKRILEDAGYRVLPASDGEEALRVFHTHSETIDLALLDVVMPKVGGREALARMREAQPHLRALFASGYSMNGSQMSPLSGESAELIQKPYGPRNLLRKVREVLDVER
jgi:two-component system, cell cycle sensor histidine kinase and response regulator CckA